MTEHASLRIGPLQWNLQAFDKRPVRYSASGYRDFFFSAPANQPDGIARAMTVAVACRECPLPAAIPLYQAGSNWAVWELADQLLFCTGIVAGASPRAMLTVDRDLRAAELSLHPAHDAVRHGYFDSPLRYPLDQALSWGLLAELGGLLMHGALVVKDGVGYVFSGRSGAGKSTLSSLCHQDGWVVLNDDRSLLFKRDGAWRACGTPWHGSGRFAQAGEYPLGGVMLLQQAPRDWVEEAGPHAARLAMLDVAAVPWFEDRWCQRALDAVDDLVGQIPVRRFHFTRSSSAVQCLEAWIQDEAGTLV